MVKLEVIDNHGDNLIHVLIKKKTWNNDIWKECILEKQINLIDKSCDTDYKKSSVFLEWYLSETKINK